MALNDLKIARMFEFYSTYIWAYISIWWKFQVPKVIYNMIKKKKIFLFFQRLVSSIKITALGTLKKEKALIWVSTRWNLVRTKNFFLVSMIGFLNY